MGRGVGVGLAVGGVLVAQGAGATTLPAADLTQQLQAGAGLTWAGAWAPGWAVSCDAPVGTEASLGAGLAGRPGGLGPWSLRALYRLVRGDATTPAVAALAAAWGPGTNAPGPWALPAVGFSMAYTPWPRLTVRLNLGYSVPPPGLTERWTFLGGAPCLGTEVGWRVSEGLEVTAGLTGAGELLGLRARF
ncbi:MAG: hypothetical protein VKQ33_14435 [Candidatus Sericytochromatia bacterium]|nr:hypothetical protein [Candidatus Sericytochromatia bacterium]